MLNSVVLVGRLTKKPEVTSVNGKEFSTVVIAVPRSFKNADGVYETDFLKCILWNNIALNTAEYCHKGDLVGIKGRLQGSKKEVEVVVEKVTFLSTKQGE